jgi:predicted GNAT family acetyltransferase
MDDRPTTEVTRNDTSGRYELRADGELLSWATYTVDGGVVTVPHVETELRHRGNHYSSTLMAGVVADLRARDLRIEPLCWVARSYVESLTDAETLLAG